ncbi:hypothetical protein [Rhodococcus erythropolis]
MTDVESAAFFACLVIDEGFVLGYVEEVAALLRELRQFFEEGGEVPAPGPYPPGGEPVPPSVEMWLTDLDEKLRHVMVVEETFVESVRYFFPVSDGQQVSANSIDLKKLQQEAFREGRGILTLFVVPARSGPSVVVAEEVAIEKAGAPVEFDEPRLLNGVVTPLTSVVTARTVPRWATTESEIGR